MDGACSIYGNHKCIDHNFIGNCGGKRPIERSGCRWQNHILIYVVEERVGRLRILG
jgi:hypothetical protein